MAERAIFLDRDNTIIEDKEGFIGDPARVKLLPGAATAISGLRRLGYRIIIVSNQSGVARGMFDEAAVEAVNQEMCRQLREQAGAHIDASYYCPYHAEAVIPQYRVDHDWRKPKPGMLKQAAEDFGLDLGQCWMIGDQPRDIAAGAAVGCRTILLHDPDHIGSEADSSANLSVSPNFIVKTLADSARIIAREGRNPHPDLVPLPLQPATAQVSQPTGEQASPSAAEEVLQSAAEPFAVPTQPAAPAAVAQPVSVAIDHAALASGIADAIARQMPRPEPLRPTLDEILVQLRQRNRHDEIPEFTLGRMVAILTQVAVAGCMVLAIYNALQALPAPHANWWAQTHSLLRSGLWLLGALVLQGFVIALLLNRPRN